MDETTKKTGYPFQALALVGVALIGLAVFYHLIIYVPRRDRERLEEQRRREAQEQTIREQYGAEAKVEAARKEQIATELRYRQECIDKERHNRESLNSALSICKNADCAKVILDSPIAAVVGEQYISACTGNKLQGMWGN